MFNFLCRSILHGRKGCSITAQNPSMALSLSLRYFSVDANKHSFTLSYLINTCGLSSKSALSACKHVQFETSDKPDSLITFFMNHGFSKGQISEIIRKYPKILTSNHKKTIFPKVEFFKSKCTSLPDLVWIFTSHSYILKRSLENHLIPSFNFLRDLLQSDEKTISSIKRCTAILYCRLEDNLIPNIKILRENGVPETNISFFVRYHPQKILFETDKFRRAVDEVKEMGFCPMKLHFVLAIIPLIRKSKWDERVDAYKRWGWSNEDIITAFMKYPWSMTLSRDKINGVMDFYVNKLGLDSSVIANRPLLVSLSLKKRLVPRASVILYLSSKGLVKIDSRITILFEHTEKLFMEKCVNCYKEAPHLLKLYKEKLDVLKREETQQLGKGEMQ